MYSELIDFSFCLYRVYCFALQIFLSLCWRVASHAATYMRGLCARNRNRYMYTAAPLRCSPVIWRKILFSFRNGAGGELVVGAAVSFSFSCAINSAEKFIGIRTYKRRVFWIFSLGLFFAALGLTWRTLFCDLHPPIWMRGDIYTHMGAVIALNKFCRSIDSRKGEMLKVNKNVGK